MTSATARSLSTTSVCTHVPAAALSLFGSALTQPGVHCLAPDADGFTWFAVVSDHGQLMAIAAVAPEEVDANTDAALCRWRESAMRRSGMPALRLLRGSGTDGSRLSER